MSLIVNAVIQSGIVKWPALRYDSGSRPEFRFVLYREMQNTDGQTFTLSIPCCAEVELGNLVHRIERDSALKDLYRKLVFETKMSKGSLKQQSTLIR